MYTRQKLTNSAVDVPQDMGELLSAVFLQKSFKLCLTNYAEVECFICCWAHCTLYQINLLSLSCREVLFFITAANFSLISHCLVSGSTPTVSSCLIRVKMGLYPRQSLNCSLVPVLNTFPCAQLSRVSILTSVALWIRTLLCCCWVWTWNDKKFNQIFVSGLLRWDLGHCDFKCLP